MRIGVGERVSEWALKGERLVGCVRAIEIARAVGARRSARMAWIVWDCILAYFHVRIRGPEAMVEWQVIKRRV